MMAWARLVLRCVLNDGTVQTFISAAPTLRDQRCLLQPRADHVRGYHRRPPKILAFRQFFFPHSQLSKTLEVGG